MIIDTLDNANFYKTLSANIETAINYLKSTDLQSLELGKHEIDGNKVFALLLNYETQNEFKDKWEAHRKYLDIHYIIEGNERIAVANILDMNPITEYEKNEDFQLFKGKGAKLYLRKNDFIILGPNDVHQPGICFDDAVSEVRKIVIKAMI
ncbi:YhcH/YjgK/YiaL family protein [Aquimarina mytili]|uniref:YhcH/YjgK/YiaL family protein n=1 Tax=Aquimarina mytili TaxID=874423 RepID=A0A937DC87_9FLAO|nr:YhcH/YjgK/YiaL family protein [Aquimarina mytili]MBL0684671.1 YhcH/YjgK/YiaL family protein [Aquimarina mytili]